MCILGAQAAANNKYLVTFRSKLDVDNAEATKDDGNVCGVVQLPSNIVPKQWDTYNATVTNDEHYLRATALVRVDTFKDEIIRKANLPMAHLQPGRVINYIGHMAWSTVVESKKLPPGSFGNTGFKIAFEDQKSDFVVWNKHVSTVGVDLPLNSGVSVRLEWVVKLKPKEEAFAPYNACAMTKITINDEPIGDGGYGKWPKQA